MNFINKSPITAEPVARFVSEKVCKDSPLEARLREETRQLPNGGMISGSDAGSFLHLLTLSIGATRALEIGTFTGYTALKIALALPEDGQLICCDINQEWTNIGRRYWREAGVDKRIDLRLGPALKTLDELAAGFDFAFIDANKKSYGAYFDKCLELVRPGGLIVLDNMLWDGAVAEAEISDSTTRYLRDLNFKIAADPRVTASLLTVGDGLMVARVK